MMQNKLPLALSAFIMMILLFGCIQLPSGLPTLPQSNQSAPPSPDKSGCELNPCPASETCVKNQCIKTTNPQTPPTKSGCEFKDPMCQANEECQNNVCVPKLGCLYSNPVCPSTSTCVNNRCVIRSEYQNLCRSDNLVESTLDTYGDSHTPINRGQCTRFVAGAHTYTIYLQDLRDEFSATRTYDLIIFDESGTDHSISMNDMKYLKLDDLISIEPSYRASSGATLMNIHRIIPSSQVQIEADCGSFTDSATCQRFRDNTKRLIVAIEQATGKNLGDCYNTVQYVMDPSIDNGYAYADGNTGRITNGNFMTAVFAGKNVEVHEPTHLLQFCANMNNDDIMNHFFWEPTESEINAAYGDSALAQENHDNAAYWENQIANDPSILGRSGDSYGGCPGIKTHLMAKRYLIIAPTSPNTASRSFVRSFYTNLDNDPRNLISNGGADESAMKSVVCQLSQDAACADLEARYC